MGARSHFFGLCLVLSLGTPALAQDFELPAGDGTADDLGQDEAALEPSPEAAPEPVAVPQDRVLVVVLTDTPKLAGLAAELSVRGTQALARRLQATAAGLGPALNPDFIVRRTERQAEAAAEVAEGVDAFESLDLERAKEILQDAVDGLIADLPTLKPAERTALAQGLFALATTVLFDGDTEGADHTLAALAAIDPGFKPESGRYPSNVIRRFERSRGSASQEQGQLEVRTEPPGAQVYLRGGLRGVSPLTIVGLSAGTHTLTLQHPAYAPRGQLVVVRADHLERVHAELADSMSSGTWRGLSPKVALDAAVGLSAAKAFDVERLAFIRLSGSALQPEIEGLWLDCRTSKVMGRILTRSLSEDLRSSAVQLAMAVAGSKGLLEIPSEPELGVQIELPKDFWLWAAVGTAAVAVAGATGWALTRQGETTLPPNTAIFGF